MVGEGRARVGDELLGPVDDPVGAVACGAGADVAGVGAAGRLGEAEGAEALAGGHGRQVLGPEVVAGQVVEEGGRDRLDVDGDGQRRVDDRELLGGDAHAAEVGAGAAIGLGDPQAERPEPADLPHEVGVEPAVEVALHHARRHHPLAELLDGLLPGDVLVVEAPGEVELFGHGEAPRGRQTGVQVKSVMRAARSGRKTARMRVPMASRAAAAAGSVKSTPVTKLAMAVVAPSGRT